MSIKKLRVLMIVAAVCSMVCFSLSYSVLRSDSLQQRLVGKPDYFGLTARAMAEKLYAESSQPVGVFLDESLVGINLQRNSISYGVASQPKVNGSNSRVASRTEVKDSWEVRYSPSKQKIYTLKCLEIYPRPVNGVLPVLSQSLPACPLDYVVGSFNPKAVRTSVTPVVWDLQGVDLFSFAQQADGPESAKLLQLNPTMSVAEVQALLSSQVARYYDESANILSRIFIIMTEIGIVVFGLTVYVLSMRGYHLSENESAVRSARYSDWTAYEAVKLAAKFNPFYFCLCRDPVGYAESVCLRQSEVLELCKESLSEKRSMLAAAVDVPLAYATAGVASNQNGLNRRQVKLEKYKPTEKSTKESQALVLGLVSEATKVVAADRSLDDLSIPRELLPEDFREFEVMAAMQVLKRLLAGWGGGACFDTRRLGEQKLKRRVLDHQPELIGHPKAYNTALARLVQLGVVIEFHKPHATSFSIASTQGAVRGEQSLELRAFLSHANQKRRGMR